MPDNWIHDSDAYGPQFRDHLIDQYKLYVEMMDHISERRMNANNYLMTANAGLVGLLGLAASMPALSKGAWVYVVPVAGIALCLAWISILHSYRNLNAAKFKVIHSLEKHLPAALYTQEWRHAEQGRGVAYKPISHIEPFIPWVFVALYVLLAILALCGCGPVNCPPSSPK